MLEEALSQKKGKGDPGTQIENHVLPGVSYMIPVVMPVL